MRRGGLFLFIMEVIYGSDYFQRGFPIWGIFLQILIFYAILIYILLLRIQRVKKSHSKRIGFVLVWKHISFLGYILFLLLDIGCCESKYPVIDPIFDMRLKMGVFEW